MKKVGYFNHAKSGCFWYRIKRPMEALAKHGVPTELIALNQDVDLQEIQSIQTYGIYPFSFGKALQYVKEQGIKIIYDLDDATDLVDVTNPAFYAVKRDAFSQREILEYADVVTASTPIIAEYIKAKTSVPITVVPNAYTPEEWTFPRPVRDGIRIGFAGSPTHIDDLLLVLPAIRNLQKKYDIRFLLFGFDTNTFENFLRQMKLISTNEGLAALKEFETLLKDIHFEWTPYTDFDYYPSTLTNMALDIGICPLKDTPFNRCRSASKALEYTLAGALALASDVAPYRQDPTSILVKDDGWEEALEYYIQNVDQRRMEQVMHRQWLQDNRDVNTQIELLQSVYVTQ